MKVRKLNKLILLLILTFNCHMAMCQDKFISYQDFEFAYKRNPDLSSLSKRFNLLYVLLLDSSHKDRIFRYDPQLEEEFKGSSPGLKLNKSTVGFVTQYTDIKEVFSSTSRIMNCLFDESYLKEIKHTISYPIYIKNNTAVAEIMTSTISEVYYFRLHDGVVRINLLQSTME